MTPWNHQVTSLFSFGPPVLNLELLTNVSSQLYCFITNYSKAQWLETMNFYLTVSLVGLWAYGSWVLLIQGLSQAVIRASGLHLSEDSTEEGSASRLPHMVMAGFGSSGLLNGRPQFLTGCWPGASLSSLSCEPLHRAAQSGPTRGSEGDGSHSLISEMTFRYFDYSVCFKLTFK